MNRLITTLAIVTFCLYGCRSTDKTIEAGLTAAEINSFIENNRSTGNEYATIEKAHSTFAKGETVSRSGLEALKPYLQKETDDTLYYKITLIHNEGMTLLGNIEVDQKNNKIRKSRFLAKKYKRRW